MKTIVVSLLVLAFTACVVTAVPHRFVGEAAETSESDYADTSLNSDPNSDVNSASNDASSDPTDDNIVGWLPDNDDEPRQKRETKGSSPPSAGCEGSADKKGEEKKPDESSKQGSESTTTASSTSTTTASFTPTAIAPLTSNVKPDETKPKTKRDVLAAIVSGP